MESREEIESMRVADLRAFLRRHGQLPTVVTRVDGTPGPPRKADLLRAALAIQEAASQGRSPAEALTENPDLSAYSPPRRQSTPQSSANHDEAVPNPFQTKVPSPARPAPTTPTPRETKTPERRKRRSSAAWIDPAILGALSAKKNVPPNQALQNRQQTPARPSSRLSNARDTSEPVLVPDDSPPQAPSSDARPTSRPARATASKSRRATDARRNPQQRPFRDVEFPDEDEQLDVDFNAADPSLADAFDDVDDYSNELIDEDRLFDPATLDEDRRDVLVHSDYDGSPARTSDHDGDSTIETDDEVPADDFQTWDVMKLRKWLANHNVRYARDSRKSELVSLARAHSLQIETAADGVQLVEEDVITVVPRSTAPRSRGRSSARRRRIITAPGDEDEIADEPIDVDAITNARSAATRRVNSKRRTRTYPAPEDTGHRRIRFSATYFVALITVVIGTVCLWSALTVYRSHTRPFCDTDDLTSYTAGGEECRKCPQFGKCFNGTLTCDIGYVPLGGKVCVEDQESSIFGEELAKDAYTLLSQLAGHAECGEIESGALSLAELKTALMLKHSERPSAGLFQWGVREHDPLKFEIAFEKALKRLRDEDYADVSISVFDEYKSNSPVMSLACTMKLAIRRNWRLVAASFGALLLFIYVKIYLYLRKLQLEELDNAYRLALQHLREQKGGFVRSEEEFAFISDIILRQEVLGHPTEKVIKLWKKVEELLKNDSRVAWSANRVVKGVPSNTFEWRSRVSKGGVFASGGSLRSLDSPAMSDGPASSPTGVSWLVNARRQLFNPQ